MVIEEAYRLFEAQANNSKFLSHCNAGIFAELANLATCVREVEVFYKSICPLSDLTLPSGEQERKILADFKNPAVNARDEWTGLSFPGCSHKKVWKRRELVRSSSHKTKNS
jgi:hypothetical protein